MPDIQMVPMPGHTSQGDTYLDTDGMVDAAGNRFSLLAQAVPNAGNDTYVTLYKITPQGTYITWVFRPTPNQKIDKANLLRSGNDVIVECITHAITSQKPRQLTKETAVVQGVFVTTASYEGEEGGAGAWMPTGNPPQEIEVDYQRISDIVDARVDAAVAQIVANIIPKVQWALVHGLNDNFTQAPAPELRDRLFSYLTNAAANPIQNVLDGGDQWGVERRERLKDAIREVRDEEPE
jgi:hypothetical protein